MYHINRSIEEIESNRISISKEYAEKYFARPGHDRLRQGGPGGDHAGAQPYGTSCVHAAHRHRQQHAGLRRFSAAGADGVHARHTGCLAQAGLLL